ncbi:MAG TPA: GNAT family N-acetyltransferase [Actinomycetota bacterium]|nr:GNAT family N-acetyltransferase [Actinomycetota bacterium]
MDIEIRPIAFEERPDWIRAADIAFSAATKDDEIEATLPTIEIDRSFAAVDGGRIVGTSASITTRMVVPGGARIPTAGVTMVGVQPTHRRRGINTRMMTALLDQATERGEPIAALFASEGAIYGRFGYGLAAFYGEFQAESARMGFVRGYAPSGRVELVSKDDAMPTVSRIYDSALRAGGVERNDVLRDYAFSEVGHDMKDKPWFYAVHRAEDGEADAYAVYTMKHAWPRSVPTGTIEVRESMATTPQGYADIWRYLFDIDLVATVEAWNRPLDDPLLVLVAEPRRLRFGVGDGLWVRLLDIPAALSARRYASDGRLVFEVSDPFRPETDGRHELVVEDGTGACARTEAKADLAGTVNVLGATYLGGTSFAQIAAAGQLEERTDGSVALADALFRWTPAPWSAWDF